MSDEDRERWDVRYAERPLPNDIGLPRDFAPFAEMFPTTGRGLELGCGQGAFSVWLAQRGITMHGLDVSPVAVRRARDLAQDHGVADRCHFDVVDLDDGLPAGGPANVVVCHRFWEPRLAEEITARLAPGGLLAICALSTGRYGVSSGELLATFPGMTVIGSGEGDGTAWLLAVG
ncbi:MAG: class I SAM-dependent methyltransferase [Mycobacterium sp.]